MTIVGPLDQDSFDMGHAQMSACPACIAAPSAQNIAQMAPPKDARLMFSLPMAHCAACISTVESGLQAVPGVHSARVNLTMKRVSVDADPAVTAPQLIAALKGVGYEAHELDAGLLSATETDKQGRDLLMRLGVAFFSMMNVMLLSIAVWSGADCDSDGDFFGSALLQIGLGRAAGGAAGDGCADLAGVDSGGLDFPVRDDLFRPPRLF